MWPSAMRIARTVPRVIRFRSSAGKGTNRVAAGFRFLAGARTSMTTSPMLKSLVVRLVLFPI